MGRFDTRAKGRSERNSTMTLIAIITTIIFGLLYALEADKNKKLSEMYYELLEENLEKNSEILDYYKEY